MAWSGERFVAVGWDGTNGMMLRSTDGDLWETVSETGTADELHAVAWAGTRLIAVGDNGTIVVSPPEAMRPAAPKAGESATRVDTSADTSPAQDTAAQDIAAVSDAGTEWSLVRQGGGFVSATGTTGRPLTDVAWGNGRFVAVGFDGTIVRSGDGDRWQEASESAASGWLSGVVWGGDRFVAVGWNAIVHSSDGDRWEAPGRLPSGRFRDVAWNGERFVAVGLGGAIAHSADGSRWSEAAQVPTEESLRGVAWGDGRFIAVGDGGTIVHSADGDRWEPAGTSATSEQLDHVAWGNGRYVAVGDDTGVIVHSADGDRWEEARDSKTERWLSSVVWTGTHFVAVRAAWTGHVSVYSVDGDGGKRRPKSTLCTHSTR